MRMFGVAKKKIHQFFWLYRLHAVFFPMAKKKHVASPPFPRNTTCSSVWVNWMVCASTTELWGKFNPGDVFSKKNGNCKMAPFPKTNRVYKFTREKKKTKPPLEKKSGKKSIPPKGKMHFTSKSTPNGFHPFLSSKTKWNKNQQMSHERNPYYFPLYWLVNRGPYNGLS